MAGSWRVGSGNAAVTNIRTTELFTVSADLQTAAKASNGISLGPLSLQGPSIALAGMQFKDGKVVVSVAIGVKSAGLAFGGAQGAAGQTSSGIKASVSDLLGTFDVSVDVLALSKVISGGGSLRSVFSVPGDFTIQVGKLDVEVPELFTVTASGIVFNWHPSDVEDALGDEIKKDLHLDLGALSTSALGEVGIPAGWNLSQIDADPSTPLFTSLIPQGYSAVVRTIVPYSIPAEGILGALIKKDLDLDLGALSPTASGEVQLPAAWNLSQYDANPSTADVLDPLTPDGGRATVRTIVPLNGDKGRWQILTRNEIGRAHV